MVEVNWRTKEQKDEHVAWATYLEFFYLTEKSISVLSKSQLF
jgi:hypothetical protein